MLHAQVFRLVALDESDLPQTLGHFAHAAFLALLAKGDAALTSTLHEKQGAKPFTTAVHQPLFPAHPAQDRALGSARRGGTQSGQLQPGDERLLRITLLDDTLYHALMAPLLDTPEALVITLGAAGFRVAEAPKGGPGASWAGQTEPTDLVARAGLHDLITLELYSPTAFSRGQSEWGKLMDVLPTPTAVFDSLIGKWKMMASIQGTHVPLPDRAALMEFIQQRVVVARIEGLRTSMLRYTSGPQIGSVGTIAYRIKGLAGERSGGGVQRDATVSEETTAAVRWLNILADFAFYSGIGYRTPMGMGQARRIHP